MVSTFSYRFLIAGALWVTQLSAATHTYQYEIVAQIPQAFAGYNLAGPPPSQLSIDDDGYVYFASQFADPNSADPNAKPWGIFSQDGLLVRTGQQISGLTIASIEAVSVSTQGQVYFLARYLENNGGRAIFTPDHVVAKPGDTIGGYLISNIYGLLWGRGGNSAGTAAFLATSSDLTLRVFTQDAMLAEPGQWFGWDGVFAVSGVPVVNESGDVIFHAQTTSGIYGIFNQNGVVYKTGQIIDVYQPILNSFSRPVANSNGGVSFYAEFPTAEAIFTLKRLIAKTGDVIDGRTINGLKWQGISSINDAEAVAFPAHYTDAFGGMGSGIFLSDGGDVTTVARGGISVQGTTLYTTYGSPVINNQGQIAFTYTTDTNGAIAIVLATPNP